jgi:hypothetical protein
MFIHRKRRRSCVPAVLTFLALLSTTAVVHAGELDAPDETGDGWRKVIAYGRCAFAVFTAVSPVQWTAAFLDCGKLFLDEPPLGGGTP